jgi:hypothetical protein
MGSENLWWTPENIHLKEAHAHVAAVAVVLTTVPGENFRDVRLVDHLPRTP